MKNCILGIVSKMEWYCVGMLPVTMNGAMKHAQIIESPMNLV